MLTDTLQLGQPAPTCDEEVLDPVVLPGDDACRGKTGRELGVAHDGVVGAACHDRLDVPRVAAHDELDDVLTEQQRRAVPVARGQRVAQRVGDQLALAVPGRRAAVQLAQQHGVVDPVAQHVGDQRGQAVHSPLGLNACTRRNCEAASERSLRSASSSPVSARASPAHTSSVTDAAVSSSMSSADWCTSTSASR